MRFMFNDYKIIGLYLFILIDYLVKKYVPEVIYV